MQYGWANGRSKAGLDGRSKAGLEGRSKAGPMDAVRLD